MLENPVYWKQPRFFQKTISFHLRNNQMTTQRISLERGRESKSNGTIYYSKF